MEIYYWIRVILSRWKSLIFFPVFAAVLLFVLTMNSKKEYISSSLIYTGIGSGFNITSTSEDRLDYYAFNVAFDNLTATVYSRECMERTALDLLAWRLSHADELAGENFQEELNDISEAIGGEFLSKAALLSPVNFRGYLGTAYDSLQNPDLIKFINDGEHNYDVNFIRKTLKVSRKASSDMLELVYTSSHPLLVKQTLEFIIHNFTKIYRDIKIKETKNVVEYFQQQFDESKQNLRLKENNMRRFGTENRIINYYEQTKFIAEGREKTEELQFKYRNDLAAAENAVNEILVKLEKNNQIFEISQNIKDTRKELADLNYQLANIQFSGDTTGANARKLNQKIKETEQKLRDRVVNINNFNFSEGGMNRENLLRSWLENVIDYDKAEARLLVIEKRLEEFDTKYDRFAPLGSTLKGLEREVEIAEKDYLQNLVSLNEAILRQKNLDLSSALTVVDPPFLPQKSESTHRLLLVVFAAIFTGFLLLSLIIGQELLDNAIRSSVNLKKRAGIETMVAFPHFQHIPNNVDGDEIKRRIQHQISNGLLLRMFENGEENKRPKFIALVSNEPKAGKSFVMEHIETSMAELHATCAYLFPQSHSPQQVVHNPMYYSDAALRGTFNVSPDAAMESVLGLNQEALTATDYVFIEIPAAIDGALPLHILTKMDAVLMVVNASKPWIKAQSDILVLFDRVGIRNVMAVLNHVRLREIEFDLGDIPKDRGPVRQVVKNFFSKVFNRA